MPLPRSCRQHGIRETPNDEYNKLEATYDLAHALSISSFSQVVLVDGEPRGVVLARAASDRLPYAAAWDHAKEDILQQMWAIDKRATAGYLAFLKNEERVNGRLLEQSGISGSDQITLLAVSGPRAAWASAASCSTRPPPTYRRAAPKAPSSTPIRTARGSSTSAAASSELRSIARTREERKLLPREMYLYGLDLSA